MSDMTTLSPHPTPVRRQQPGGTPHLTPRPEVEIVIPVYNEQDVLAASVHTLHRHLTESTLFTFQITIADNASTDDTLDVAHALSRELPGVRVLHLNRKGRGRALRAAWGASRADVLAYMDVDLSTDIAHVGELLQPLLEGRGDIAIGSRLAPGARVIRSARREAISRTYNMILRTALGAGFSDAQCGFKAGRREVIQGLLPLIEDEEWFFDTELLHRARMAKLSIHEVPVHWVEDPDSSVDVIATAREDLRGVVRLRRDMRADGHRQAPPRDPRSARRERRRARAGAPLGGQHA
jgi:glycosyltransferase involved in cell wall biosynthesis